VLARDDSEIVESSFEWKEEVDDIAVLEFEHGKECISDPFAKISVLHRR
jgi:hypothetical protein